MALIEDVHPRRSRRRTPWRLPGRVPVSPRRWRREPTTAATTTRSRAQGPGDVRGRPGWSCTRGARAGRPAGMGFATGADGWHGAARPSACDSSPSPRHGGLTKRKNAASAQRRVREWRGCERWGRWRSSIPSVSQATLLSAVARTGFSPDSRFGGASRGPRSRGRADAPRAQRAGRGRLRNRRSRARRPEAGSASSRGSAGAPRALRAACGQLPVVDPDGHRPAAGGRRGSRPRLGRPVRPVERQPDTASEPAVSA